MNILVCAAHPDDEALGMGATMAKLADAGHCIYCWFYFSGVNCNGVMQTQTEEIAALLGVKHAAAACDAGDNKSDCLPLLDIARSIEKAIGMCNPEVVYTHSIRDLNIDHRHVAEATLVAARPKTDTQIKRLLAYEVPLVTDRAFGSFGGGGSGGGGGGGGVFRPNVYENVSGGDAWGRKCDALRRYQEMLDTPLLPQVEAVAQYRGMQIGCGMAEAFELVWERK